MKPLENHTRYFPVLTKEEYRKQQTGSLVSDYFDGSFKDMVSYFIKDKKLDMKDLDEIMKSIKQKKKS